MSEKESGSALFEKFQKEWAAKQAEADRLDSLRGMERKAARTRNSRDLRHVPGQDAKRAWHRRKTDT